MNRTRTFQILDLRCALNPGLRHAVPKLAGGHELSRRIGALPIEQQEEVVRVIHIVEDTKADFPRSFPGDDMRIEGFFPAIEIRNLVTDQNVNHKSVLHISIVLSKIRNLPRNVNSQMNQAV